LKKSIPKAQNADAKPWHRGPIGARLEKMITRCSKCGETHDIANLEPAFRRPDSYVALPVDKRDEIAQANNDMCIISEPDKVRRYFVRGVLHVDVEGYEEGTAWGIWVELSLRAFDVIHEMWDDPNQGNIPAMLGTLANQVPRYPLTIGLPVQLQMAGENTRPTLIFPDQVDHPFSNQVRAGVTAEQVSLWLCDTKNRREEPTEEVADEAADEAALEDATNAAATRDAGDTP